MQAYQANAAITAELTAALGLGFNISVSVNENKELVLTVAGTAGAGISGFFGASTSNQSRSDGWYSELCASGKAGLAVGGCIGANLSPNVPLMHSMKLGTGIGLIPIDANANYWISNNIKANK